MTTEEIGLYIQAVSAFSAVGALVFTGLQLKGVADSARTGAEASRISSLMAVLQLEEGIRSARRRWAEAAGQAMKIANAVKSANPPSDDEINGAKALLAESAEEYLNTMDRLCACIVRGLVNEDVYRRDFRNWIDETVREFPDDFRAGTRYFHVLRCHNQWKDEKSAKDPTVMALLNSSNP
ncbi:MAG TPA: hypothetical protein VFZ09_46410 [Archangium sp.]|uniref:hypothetical protein n=1 Tax=Archangium sp. TaxID=1872627 RepID=UPI002E330F38|nr:hypothetical protein [Archangium sp.]HEX5753712.1 hypothetical protein [Archangium sp.]